MARPGTRLFATEGELVIEGQSVSLGYLRMKKRQPQYLILKTVSEHIILGIKLKLKMDCGFIQGRIDFQIKLNGYRMELEEIETQLRQSKHVREAVVVPVYKMERSYI